MKEDRILNALSGVDEKYIIEAVPAKKKTGKSRWVRWAAVAACFILILGGVFVLTRPSKSFPDTSGELPQIVIPEYASNSMGFEGLMCYSPEELKNGNPWREESELETLPVFRNGCYDPSGAGMPFGLSEEEILAELERAADVLGLEIEKTETDTNATKSEDGSVIAGDTVLSIRGVTDKGSLTVYADGSLEYDLPRDFSLPEEYHFTYSDTSDKEAEVVMAYLTKEYSSLLSFKNPEPVLQGDYTINGDYVRRYLVYDAGTNETERILNYSFRTAAFAPDDNGNLMLIKITDGLLMAEKIGDYPVISVTEAKEKLLAGQYQTSVPVAISEEKYIVKAELVYRSGRREETLLPYYRFYVELQDVDGWEMKQDNGLKTYGAYYVPAIQDEYISNLTTYDGHFN